MRYPKIIISLIIMFSLGGTGIISGEILKRNINLQIEVDSRGSAKMIRKEEVGASALANLYCEHAKALEEDIKVKKQFLYEAGKGYRLIFGEKPRLSIENQTISSSLTREVAGQFSYLARSRQKGVKEIRIRQFQDQKSVVPYLEYVLDSRLFESAFLGSVKGEQTLVSREETTFQLPAAARIINEKELEGRKWLVDFGGKNIMEANLKVDAGAGRIILSEQIVVSENAPTNLLAKDNTPLIDKLREYGAFVIQYETGDSSSQREPVPSPAPPVEALDFSSSWNLGVSQTFSHDFKYQQVTTITPSINLSFNLRADVKWEWRWYWSGWRLRCTLDYFETKLTLAPAVGANISISNSAVITQSWEKTVTKQNKSFTFTVACVPVLIVLEADLKLKASCDLKGAITVGTGGKVTLNTGITCRYQNGWKNISPTFYVIPQFTGFNASAGIYAKARGEAPFTVSAYIYYVAGPFAQLNPYIEVLSEYKAQTSGQTGIHFNLHGGFEVNGGAKVAGWLQNLLGNLGQYTRNFFTKDVQIYDGWAQ
jgi:hypothetical protein